MRKLLFAFTITAWIALGWLLSAAPHKPNCMKSQIVENIDVRVEGLAPYRVGSCDQAGVFEAPTPSRALVGSWIRQLAKIEKFLSFHQAPFPKQRVSLQVKLDTSVRLESLSALGTFGSVEHFGEITSTGLAKFFLEVWAKETFHESWRIATSIREMATDLLMGAAEGVWLAEQTDEQASVPRSHIGVCESQLRAVDQTYFCARLVRLKNEDAPVSFHGISSLSLRPKVGRELEHFYLGLDLSERHQFLEKWLQILPYLNVSNLSRATAVNYRDWYELGRDYIRILSLRSRDVQGEPGWQPQLSQLVERERFVTDAGQQARPLQISLGRRDGWIIQRFQKWDFFSEVRRPVTELEPEELPANQVIWAQCRVPQIGEVLIRYPSAQRVLYVEDCPKTSIHADLSRSLPEIRERISPRAAGSVVQFHIPSLRLAVSRGLSPEISVTDMLKAKAQPKLTRLLGLEITRFYEWVDVQAPVGAVEFFKLAPQAFQSSSL